MRQINKRQLFWGIILGIVTFGLMIVSFKYGETTCREETENTAGEVTSEDFVIDKKKIEIDVVDNCGEFEAKGEENIREYCVEYDEKESVFDMMKRLDELNPDFSFEYEESKLGAFVTKINNYQADQGKEFWAFLVNGEMSMEGVSDYQISKGDNIRFEIEKIK